MDLNKVLNTYSLEEILEYNDVEDSEALLLLMESLRLRLPPIPVDAYYEH